MSISVTVLTWNRASILEATMPLTLSRAGRAWDELIWVDNGSTPDQLAHMQSVMAPYNTTKVFFPANWGMQRGFNTCMQVPRGDYVVCLAPDEIMPEGWLDTFMTYMERIPDTGMATMYDVPHERCPDRYYKREIEVVNGLRVLRAMPMGIFMVRRRLLPQLGLWREDLGLYGWGDVEWAHRVNRIMPTIGHQAYVIPDHIPTHLGTEGAVEFKLGQPQGDTMEYWDWKNRQSALQRNHDVMDRCRRENYQVYWP